MTKRTGTKAEIETAAQHAYEGAIARFSIASPIPWSELSEERKAVYREVAADAVKGLYTHQAEAARKAAGKAQPESPDAPQSDA